MHPASPAHRRYEALRAYLAEGLPAAEAAARFGYTPASLLSAVRDFRAGARDFFVSGRPGPKTAPGKDAARPRIIELRAAGHSIDEIADALAAEGTPLNRTGIAEVIAAEGLPRMWRRPDAERGGPARQVQARAEALDFAMLAGRAETRLAGLFLAIPDLIALGVPEMVAAAGYPSTGKIPALSYALSLLALKLTSTRRVSHVYDIAADPGAALFAGLTALPKATALTTYSYRLEHSRQAAFLTALDKAAITAGLAQGEALNLDFHAVMHWGEDPVPGKALRAAPLPAHPVGADLLRRGRRHPHPGLRQRRPVQSQPEPGSHRVLRPLEGRHRVRPGAADLRLQAHHPGRPRRTRRPPDRVHHPARPPPRHHQGPGRPARHRLEAHDPRPGRRQTRRVRVHDDPAATLSAYPRPIRQLAVTGLGTPAHPADHQPAPAPAPQVIGSYARRMNIEQRLAEAIQSFGLDALAGAVPLNVDLDVVLSVLAHTVCAALRRRLPGHRHPRHPPTALPEHRRHHREPQRPDHHPRAYSPILRQASLPETITVPWWQGRTLRYQYD